MVTGAQYSAIWLQSEIAPPVDSVGDAVQDQRI